MTTLAPPVSPSARPGALARALGSAMVGNGLELLDFIFYGYFAAQIGKAMFPAGDPLTTLLASFATYGVGFLARPVGSLVIGSWGDRHGRKSALVFTMLLMAGATCLTGLIPSYAYIGVAAPVLLVLCRLAQGFAAGGEWGGAATFLVEYAPAHRRGLFGALQQMSNNIAVVLAVLIALALNATLSAQAMQDWGWRVPFVAGVLIGPVGLYLRGNVDETPRFREDRVHTRHPVREVFGPLRGMVLTIFGIVLVWTVAGYTFGTFLVSFASQTLHVPQSRVLIGTLLGAGVNIVMIPLAGHASDRFGRKPFLVAGTAGFLLLPLPLFLLMDAWRSDVSVWIATGVAGLCSGLISGTAPTFLCELLPTRLRYTALSVGYSAAVMLFGGFAPFISTLLVQHTGLAFAPAFYVSGTAVVSLAVLIWVRAPRHGEPLS